MNAIDKFNEIFKYYPHMASSKNVIHFPFPDPNDEKKMKILPGITWAELKELVDTKSNGA